MDTDQSSEAQIRAEIEALRPQFPNTQELYREVCILLFFRYGQTPTANRLYQLVRKGSMSAPAEALGKFWSDLREKSRVRLEHPDLPDELKTMAGDLVGALWTKAQGLASDTLATLRGEAQAAVAAAEAGMRTAETANAAVRAELEEIVAARDLLASEVRVLKQALAAETATGQALAAQVDAARQTTLERENALAEARRDFAFELEKLRAALSITEERYQAAEARALLEIDRERTIAARLQKDIETIRSAAAESAERQRAEARRLQVEIGNQRQLTGNLEGELRATNAIREQHLADLKRERDTTQELAAKLAAALRDADTWQEKAINAHQEMEMLKTTRRRKGRKPVGQPDMDENPADQGPE